MTPAEATKKLRTAKTFTGAYVTNIWGEANGWYMKVHGTKFWEAKNSTTGEKLLFPTMREARTQVACWYYGIDS